MQGLARARPFFLASGPVNCSNLHRPPAPGLRAASLQSHASMRRCVHVPGPTLGVAFRRLRPALVAQPRPPAQGRPFFSRAQDLAIERSSRPLLARAALFLTYAIAPPAFRSQADLGEFNRLRAVGSLLVPRLTMLRHTRGQLLSRGRCLPCQGDRIPALQGRATVRQSQTLVA
jgi:hypothetical protein